MQVLHVGKHGHSPTRLPPPHATGGLAVGDRFCVETSFPQPNSVRGPSKGKFGKCLLVRSRSLTRRRASISSPLRRLGPCRELWCSCHWRSPPRRSWQPARPSRHRVCTRVSGSTAQAHAPARSPCALPWARDPRPRSTHARAHTHVHRFYTPNSLALTHRHSSTHTPQKQTCAHSHPTASTPPLFRTRQHEHAHLSMCMALTPALYSALLFWSHSVYGAVDAAPKCQALRVEEERPQGPVTTDAKDVNEVCVCFCMCMHVCVCVCVRACVCVCVDRLGVGSRSGRGSGTHL